ncbi:MAG: DUF4376 domain-containing protein [Magnetospirillum sp. WYHS-4]
MSARTMKKPLSPVLRVKAEAERRIAAGIDIGGGVMFRCDPESVGRIQGLLLAAQRLEERQEAVSISFKTASGTTVTITSAAQAGAVFDRASAHLARILARSAALQDRVAGGDVLDPANDALWA